MVANYKNGFGLIGLLVVVVIITAVGYGGLFFYQGKKSKDIYKKAYDEAEEDISEINNQIDEMNKLISTSTGISEY